MNRFSINAEELSSHTIFSNCEREEKVVAGLCKLFADGQKQVLNFHIADQELVVEWKYKSDHVKQPSSNNLYVACTTTSLSRVHMYKGLAAAGRQAIYTDTDSVIVQKSVSQLGLPISSNVGDFTNELEEGDSIASVACAGSKNYSYKTVKGNVSTKVRGFTLSYAAGQKINHDVITDIVLNNPEKQIVTTIPDQIFRDKNNFKIYSKDMNKAYSMVNDKRIYFPDHSSLPYGYYHSDAPDLRVDMSFNPITPLQTVGKYKFLEEPVMGNEDSDYE